MNMNFLLVCVICLAMAPSFIVYAQSARCTLDANHGICVNAFWKAKNVVSLGCFTNGRFGRCRKLGNTCRCLNTGAIGRPHPGNERSGRSPSSYQSLR